MISSCRTGNVVSKPCRNCNGQLIAPDNFCRWCGFQLSEGSASVVEMASWQSQKTTILRNHADVSQSFSRVALDMLTGAATGHGQETTVLRAEEEISQSLSRVALNTLKQNVAMKTGSLRLNRFGVLVIAVLISIPMWLLIILLSPLHAFMAAKAASSQMSLQ